MATRRHRRPAVEQGGCGLSLTQPIVGDDDDEDGCVVPLEMALQLCSTLDADFVVCSSRRLMEPLGSDSADMIDVEGLIEAFNAPRIRTTDSPAKRHLEWLRCANRWAPSMVFQCPPCGCSSSTSSSSSSQHTDMSGDVLEVVRLARYFGVAAVIAPMSAIDAVADDLHHPGGTTQWWVPVPRSDDAGWSLWSEWRNSPTVLQREGLAGILIRPVLTVGCEALSEGWLGEDVAAIRILPTEHATSDGTSDASKPSLWGWCGQTMHSVPATLTRTQWLHEMRTVRRVPVIIEGLSMLQTMMNTDASSDGAGAIVFNCDAFAAVSAAVERWSLQTECAESIGREAVDDSGEDVSTWQRRLRRFTCVEDGIQVPLQPQSEALENAVYDAFEEDTVKYQRYREAMDAFFSDYLLQQQQQQQPRVQQHRPTVVVIGPGRGPLITQVLLSATMHGMSSIHVVAVERNPSALWFLEQRIAYDEDWQMLMTIADDDGGRESEASEAKGHSVSLYGGDARRLNLAAHRVTVGSRRTPMTMAAIAMSTICVVSELLGSSGDNELSPEILDEVLDQLASMKQHRDPAEDGLGEEGDCGTAAAAADPDVVCIPLAYRCLVAPAQSAVLRTKLSTLAQATEHRTPYAPTRSSAPSPHPLFHTPVLSHVMRCRLLSLPKEAWRFVHRGGRASSGSAQIFERRAALDFDCSDTVGRVDCLLGFMDVVLYVPSSSFASSVGNCRDDVDLFEYDDRCDTAGGRRMTTLSTVPSRWTPRGMLSWFPLVLPLHPDVPHIHLSPPARGVHVDLRRGCCPNHPVHSGMWYEWSMASSSTPTGENRNSGAPVSNADGWAATTPLW